MSYRDKQSSEDNVKGKNLMTFILDEIYKLDTDQFSILAKYLGYNLSTKDDVNMNDEENN